MITADSTEKADIESALNLANIKPEWTYSENADAWTIAIVTAVTNAELPDYQGVSVCVPGAYVKGVDISEPSGFIWNCPSMAANSCWPMLGLADTGKEKHRINAQAKK